tara:strand:- start:3023 stop:3859 length:837 start_codon:yes stop_codon:yes gene_type:complete
MPKQPSSGPTRAQNTYRPSEKLRRAIAATTKPTKVIRGKELVIYPISELKKAFRDTRLTPQARVPKTTFSRSKANIVTSHRIKDLNDDTYDHQMVTEGNLEPLFFKQCELDSNIQKTLAQPFIVDFEGYLGLGKFTMDFACYLHYGKPYAVDVKQKAALESPEYKELIKARKKAFEDHGFELKTFTEEDIKLQPMCANIFQLYAHLKSETKVLKKAASIVEDALIASGGEAPLRAFSHLPPQTVQRGTAYGLYTGRFFADHSTPFGSNFVISMENYND